MNYKNLINLFILFCAIFFISIQVWLERFFGQVDFEQLAVFIFFGLQGLLDTDDYIISKFIEICLYFPAAFITLYAIIFRLIYLYGRKYFNIYRKEKILRYKIILSILLLFFSIYNLSRNISLGDYITRDRDYDFIKVNYVKPNIQNFKNTDAKKDLVLIYIEGVEDTFIKNEFLSNETIEQLKFSKFNAKDFNDFYQTKYNNWTIGAIISTQCGIPQKPVGIIDIRRKGFMGNRRVFGLKKFLPNIYCLGDLLKVANYQNVFINAVDLNFQAMGAFFTQHGYEELIGKKYFDNIKNNNESETWGGGVNDSKLFDLAKKRIVEFKKKGERFNITLLTTDTHNPGYIDKTCDIKFKNETKKMFRAISCTANELNKFVEFVYENYSSDTSIVIIGDHLNRHIEDYIKAENLPNLKRSIYNKIISENIFFYREKINHFDLFPTILNTLNFKSNTKLGLGYTAAKEIDFDYETYRIDLEKNISNKSNYYYEFWK